MKICYNNLWKKLIDLGMTKTQLREKTGMSKNTLAKLGKNQSVNMNVLINICEFLNCNIGDVCEIKQNGEEMLHK